VVGQVCTKLKKVQLENVELFRERKITAAGFLALLKGCPLVEEVILFSCDRLFQDSIGEIGTYWPLLRKVHFTGLIHITARQLAVIARGCPLLEELHLHDIVQLTRLNVKEFLIRCPNLQRLTLEHVYAYNVLPFLSLSVSLRYLHLVPYCFKKTLGSFREDDDQRPNHIEHLVLGQAISISYGSVQKLPSVSFRRLIAATPFLQTLDLRYLWGLNQDDFEFLAETARNLILLSTTGTCFGGVDPRKISCKLPMNCALVWDNDSEGMEDDFSSRSEDGSSDEEEGSIEATTEI